MLESRLNSDLIDAMKKKDQIRLSVIRLIKSDIDYNLVSLKKDKLSDEEVLKIVQKHIKQRKDSIEQFTKGNRNDLAEKETAELNVLQGYVPVQMDDKDLESIVQDEINKIPDISIKDMGRVIKTVMDRTSGRAEGKRVSMKVKQIIMEKG